METFDEYELWSGRWSVNFGMVNCIEGGVQGVVSYYGGAGE